MSIEPETLEIPERDLELSNRGRKKKRTVDPEPETEDELASLRERVEAAALDPGRDRAAILEHDSQPHCGDCFTRGWVAAVRVIRGE
jgi:hypothetical protein